MSILSLELLKDPDRLISQDKGGGIQFWRIAGFELVLQHTIATNVIGFCKLALQNTNMVLCKGGNSIANCYSTITYDQTNIFDAGQPDILGDIMAIKAVGNYVFCGYEANTIVAWKDDCFISYYNFSEVENLMAFDVDSNVDRGICAGSSKMINMFIIETDHLFMTKSVEITNPGVSAVRVRPDNKIVAIACWDCTVRLFSWKSMKLLVILDSHSSGINDIVYSETSGNIWKANYLLAVANKDSKIALWDVYSQTNDDL